MDPVFVRRTVFSLIAGLMYFAPGGVTPLSAEGLRPMGTFFVRDLKPAAEQQHIQIGIHAEGSPMKALTKQAISDAKNQYPDIAEVVDLLREVDPAPLQTLDATAIQNELLALPGVTPEQEAIIKSKVNSGTRDQVLAVLDVLQDKEEAIVFGIRPFAMLNFPGVRATVEVPVAGFFLEGETAFALGNANLELSFAHTMASDSAVNMGIGYGLHIYAPTGTERSNSLAVQNLMVAPAYLSEYLTPAIFMNMGIQMPLLSLVAHGEITPMFAIRGEPRRDLMISGSYGIGAVLDLEFLRVQAELAGRFDIKDAEPLQSTYFVAGAAFDMVMMQLEAAFVLPVISVDPAAAGALPSADLGSASDYMVLVRLGFGI